jgi:queuine tRNA-ribosyltransferase
MTPEIFKVIRNSSNSRARTGELTLAHGVVQTPVFLPVASQGTVKAITPEDLKSIGFQMLLSNAYHLYLQPGIPVIEKMGGLHRFMGWDRPILTDSGGYQVFSLANLRRVNEDGVIFRSHIDGSEHLLTPELAVQHQESIGSDIAMVLDECPPHDSPRERTIQATERTHRWAERCLKAGKKSDQYLFAIVQGGMYSDLRRHSAEYLASLDFPGYAIGGLSLGESKQTTLDMIESVVPLLPESRSRYLMGVGSPEDLIEGVERGIDIFDCALPTRVARNGALFTPNGRINIRNAIYRDMIDPIDFECECYTCRTFSAAYLHHLFAAKELLAYRLSTIHNLTFINHLMNGIRNSLMEGNFPLYRQQFLVRYQVTEEKVRLEQKQKWLKTRQVSDSQYPEN